MAVQTLSTPKPRSPDPQSGPAEAPPQRETVAVGSVIQHLHGLVTYGPGDLDIASAMSAQGYDAVKWAEGQGVLAELVSADAPADTTLTAATDWYDEAAAVARQVLSTQPQLLAKLGLA
jgi:alpha-beta hydrolase superfamily lysophospholipase